MKGSVKSMVTMEQITSLPPDVNSPKKSKKSLVAQGPLSCFLLLKDLTVIKVVLCYAAIGFIFSVFDQVFPVWAASTEQRGGLAWDSSRIGICLSVAGVASIGMLFFFPYVAKSIGIRGTYQLGCLLMIPTFIVLPWTPDVSRLFQGPFDVIFTWAFALLAMLFRSCSGELSYTSQFILVNNCVDNSKTGTMNGLAQTIGSLGWTVGPFISGAIFAWSISESDGFPHFWPIDKSFIFLLMALFTVGTVLFAALVPKSINKRKQAPPEPAPLPPDDLKLQHIPLTESALSQRETNSLDFSNTVGGT